MEIKYQKILIFILILAFYASYITYKIELPAAQDLPREINNGENILSGQFKVITTNFYSYTEPDYYFANHQWFSGVIFYLMHRAMGWGGMVIFKVIFILLTFSLLFYITMKRSDFWLAAVFSVPAILVLIQRSALRPEMFSYSLIVLFLYFLYDFENHPEHKRIYWLIPLELLWVSLHIYFPIGVLMVGGFLLEKIVLNHKNIKQNQAIRKLSILLVALILVCFINPYGLSGDMRSLRVNKNPNFPILSEENSSISTTLKSSPISENLPIAAFEMLIPVLAASFIWALFFRWKRKEPLFSGNFIFHSLAGIATALLGFYIIRSLPLFGLIFLPAITANLGGSYAGLKNWLRNSWPGKEKAFSAAAAAVLTLGLLYLTLSDIRKFGPYGSVGIGITDQSESSAEFFRNNNLTGPIFNDNDIGSYLIYNFFPKERVFTDNRFGDAYSADFLGNTYLPMIRDEEKWKEGLKKYNFNVVFFYQYDNVGGIRDFINRRINDPEWAWVYADDYTVILVRNVPRNQEVINKYEITWNNITERLKFLWDSPNPNDLLAAADLFNLSGHKDLAENGYLKVLSEQPQLGKVWYALGSTELDKGTDFYSNPNLALIYLKQALSAGWETANTYSYIALAYYRLGEYDKAREAVKKELKIDPESVDGHKWLGILADLK